MPSTSKAGDGIVAAFRTLEATVLLAIENARHEGRTEAFAQLEKIMAQGEVRIGRGPGRPKGSKNKPKPGKKHKSWWDTATPQQKAERKRAMLAGRGLKPKGE